MDTEDAREGFFGDLAGADDALEVCYSFSAAHAGQRYAPPLQRISLET